MLKALTTLALLLPALAAAQTIDLSAIPDGGQVLHRHGSDVPLGTFTFLHGDNGTYTVEFRKEDRLTGPPDETHVYDAEGNMTAVRYGDGPPVHYRPHNCVRTVGTCDYTTHYSSGATRDFRLVNEWGEDGMYHSRRYRITDEGPIFIEAWFMSFSEDGLVEQAERRNDAGKVTWGRTAERLWSDIE